MKLDDETLDDEKEDLALDKEEQTDDKFKRGFAKAEVKSAYAEEKIVKKKKDPFLKYLDGKLGVLIIIALLLFVNLAAVLMFFFDVGQIRTHFAIMNNAKINEMTTQLGVQQQQLNQDKKALEDDKNNLETQKQALADKEAQQAQKEEALNKQQQDILDKQKTETATTDTKIAASDSVSASSSSSGADIAGMVKIYENMDAKKAAKVIVALGMKEKVLIMSAIKKDKAAEIFDAMDPAQSSTIMNAMMNGK